MQRIIFPLLLSFMLAACATRRLPVKPPTGALAPRLVGTVSLVNEELGFALIDTVETPNPGTELKTVSSDGEETARLRVSPQQKRPFIIADIAKGMPHAGDQVMTP